LLLDVVPKMVNFYGFNKTRILFVFQILFLLFPDFVRNLIFLGKFQNSPEFQQNSDKRPSNKEIYYLKLNLEN
jgi:hypothetical protein